MKINPGELLPMETVRSPNAKSPAGRTGQFFTGIVSGWIRCAKPSGIQAPTAMSAAACNSPQLNLEYLERGPSAFSCVSSPLRL